MKVKLEMELEDVLRISVLLDHHRQHRAQEAERGNDATVYGVTHANWATETAELNKKLIAAVVLK